MSDSLKKKEKNVDDMLHIDKTTNEIKSISKMKASDIKIRKDIYPRKTVHRGVVEAYKEAIQRGDNFPPIVVNQDNELIDGWHRLHALEELGREEVEVERIQCVDVYAEASGAM